ncbi:helix-turn-helix domain-containing protein [Desemzia sp. RIT804]|uniref:helix-turn-helix domain-containing protein n=1 Tax=Desemzia sp. RIT 804 TaxID=2810209 RepID=UPI00194FE274|nr:helix-turn-helix domain-containing protein [Desemzia sp. RIT 804]
MNFKELKFLYPEAILTDRNTSGEHYIAFPYQDNWIQFERHQKSDTELALIQYAINQKSVPLKTKKSSKWQSFLVEESFALPKEEGIYRIIQFEIIKKDAAFERALWIKAFKSLFTGVEDIFFTTENKGMLIQEKQPDLLSNEEMAGIIRTLDDDFSVKTVYYIGQFWTINATLPNIFQEEQRIFDWQKNQKTQVFDLSSVALHYYTAEAISQSPLMQQLKAQYVLDAELKELILAMWKSQGNISVAAKSLYIHRNTLQYRIDRFHEVSGLSLRNMDDLLLCYLLAID